MPCGHKIACWRLSLYRLHCWHIFVARCGCHCMRLGLVMRRERLCRACHHHAARQRASVSNDARSAERRRAGASSCTDCPRGKASSVSGLRANGPWVCKPCRLGYSTENLTGAAQCTACSPGSYADKMETRVCELCDPGKRGRPLRL